MNKPEILKGEVKEFVDLEKSIGSAPLHSHYAKLRDFYSQPFEPNKFFRWVIIGTGEDFEYNAEKRILRYEENNIITTIRFGFPIATNSQFITDCIQADIKLQWR